MKIFKNQQWKTGLSESLNEVSGNCQIAGFCTKYPRASRSLERPPNPLSYRTIEPPLKIASYGPATATLNTRGQFFCTFVQVCAVGGKCIPCFQFQMRMVNACLSGVITFQFRLFFGICNMSSFHACQEVLKMIVY